MKAEKTQNAERPTPNGEKVIRIKIMIMITNWSGTS